MKRSGGLLRTLPKNNVTSPAADLGVKRFDIHGRPRWLRRLGLVPKNTGRPLKKLILPLLDLVRVHVKLLG